MKVGIYARQSLDKKDSLSIETQFELCEKMLLPEDESFKYEDRGYTGSNTNRPDFQRMLRDIKNGLIQKVMIYRLDRMSRSVLDFSNLIEFFHKYGVEFQSAKENFDTTTPMGKAMLNIAMVFAQLEKETIQQRVSDNYYARGKQGFYLGGTTPYGYKIVENKDSSIHRKTLEQIPEEVEVIKMIFKMYAYHGYSLGKISKALNEREIKSPKGLNWNTVSIKRILCGGIYVQSDANIYNYYKNHFCIMTHPAKEYSKGMALYIYGKRPTNSAKYTDISGYHVSVADFEGFIDSETFLIAQKRVASNTQISKRNAGKNSWLTGLIKCGECGRSLVVHFSNCKRYSYWYCSGRQNNNGCTLGSFPLDITHTQEAVEDRLLKVVRNHSELIAHEINNKDKELQKVRIKINEVQDKISRLIDLVVDSNDLTAEYLNAKMEDLSQEKKNLIDKENKIIEEQKAGNDFYKLGSLLNDWYNLDIMQKKQIASLFMNKVSLSSDSLEIDWKYNFKEDF